MDQLVVHVKDVYVIMDDDYYGPLLILENFRSYHRSFWLQYDGYSIEYRFLDEDLIGLNYQPWPISIENFQLLEEHLDEEGILSNINFELRDGMKLLEKEISLRDFFKKYVFAGNFIEERIIKTLTLDFDNISMASGDDFYNDFALQLSFKEAGWDFFSYDIPYEDHYAIFYYTLSGSCGDYGKEWLSQLSLENFKEIEKFLDKEEALPDISFVLTKDGEKLEDSISLKDFSRKYIYEGDFVEEYEMRRKERWDLEGYGRDIMERYKEILARDEEETNDYSKYHRIQFFKTANGAYVMNNYEDFYLVQEGQLVFAPAYWKIHIGYIEAEEISKEEFDQALEASKENKERTSK